MATAAGGGPMLRVITADELGYVRCAQAAGPDTASLASMQLVARWGDGARARGVERMALTDGDDEGIEALLAVARASGEVEVMDPHSGAVLGIVGSDFTPCRGLHLVAPGAGAEGHRLLSCTQAGALRVHEQLGGARGGAWRAVGEWATRGGVACAAAPPGGGRVALGGDGADVAVYDTASGALLHAAKPPAKDWLGMYRKIYVSALAFDPAPDAAPHLLLAGGEAEVRLFDFRAQRRAVRTLPFGEGGAVCALAHCSAPGHLVAAGTTRGALGLLDLRTGRLAGMLHGCAGAVRAVAAHPRAPLLAAAALDRHVRVFATAGGRAQRAALFIKQAPTALAWDWRGAQEQPPQPPQEEEEAAARDAPRPRKHKRTSAVIDGFTRDSAARRARRADAAGDDDEAPPAAASAKKKKKKKAPRDAGMVINYATE